MNDYAYLDKMKDADSVKRCALVRDLTSRVKVDLTDCYWSTTTTLVIIKALLDRIETLEGK
jgi:hypothetical protein